MEHLLALPIGVVAAVTVAALWFLVTPLRDITPAMSLPAFLLLFAGFGVAHELSHALVHPKAGLSPHSILGFWPSRVSFYANYDGEMSRNRLVAILLMPLLTISIAPLLVSAVIQVFWLGRVFFCIQLSLRLRRHAAGRLGSLSDSSHCDCPL